MSDEDGADLPRQAQLRLELLRARYEKEISESLAKWLREAPEPGFTKEHLTSLMERVIEMAVEMGETEARERLSLAPPAQRFEIEALKIVERAASFASDRWAVLSKDFDRVSTDQQNTAAVIGERVQRQLFPRIRGLIAQAWSHHEKRLAAEISPDAIELQRDPPKTSPGEKIRKCRVDMNWSQEELADKAGLDKKTIGRVEKQAKAHTIKQLADALGKKPKDLK